jgi:protein O-GlcNAc transferase
MKQTEVETLLRQAQLSHRAGDLEGAEQHYTALLAHIPDSPDIQHLLGVVAYQRGDSAKAIAHYRHALALRPGFASAQNNLALALKSIGDASAAAKAFNDALEIDPKYGEAAFNLALLHEANGEPKQAEEAYRRALKARADWPELLGNLGNLLRREHRLDEASTVLERAVTLRPEDAAALGNLALLRIDQGRLGKGLSLAERAAKKEPKNARWWSAAGTAARLLLDADAAIPHLKRAVELAPDDAGHHFELGLALQDAGDHGGALLALETARCLAPRWERLRWAEALLLPSFVESEAQAHEALARFDRGLASLEQGMDLSTQNARSEAFDAAASTLPFGLHYLTTESDTRQMTFAGLVAKVVTEACPPPQPKGEGEERGNKGEGERKIRVGFVSSYLRNHVVARYFSAFITGLDGAEFERFVWFTGDEMDSRTQQISSSVEHFDATPRSPADLAGAIRAASLDVLVYPDIGLDPRQHALAAMRLAPVQAALAGHPVSSGSAGIDYFLSGAQLEPEGAEARYREKLVRLPGIGVAPWAPATVGDGAWAKALRLEGRPLVMCLQNLIKIAPPFDAVLAEILAASGARLVCFDRGQQLAQRFRERLTPAMQARGVGPEALHIEPVHPFAEFLGGIAEAELILDTPGFSGGGTSLDAFAVGTPVLCFEGAVARARQTSAMLRVMEIPELIAANDVEYTSRAVELLADAKILAALRATIRDRAPRLFRDDSPVRSFAKFLHDVARKFP